MQKNIVAITVLVVMLINVTGFAMAYDNSMSADITTQQTETSTQPEDCVLTPDGREVPWPEGTPEVSTLEETSVVAVQEEEKSIEISEITEEGIWTEYGFTKSEFETFPEALKNAMLNEPEEIGISFDVPTRKELAEWSATTKSAQKSISLLRTAATEKRNAVGEFIQSTGYTCGPTSARGTAPLTNQ